MTALVNDEGWDKVYSYQLENLMDDGDYLVVISVHGGVGQDKVGLWSQNITIASKMIQERGGKVIGFVGFDGGAIKTLADACVTVPIESTPHVEGFHLIHLRDQRWNQPAAAATYRRLHRRDYTHPTIHQ